MFYRTDQHHGLPHDPFKSCIVPRPIGWLTTVDGQGRVNLAPFSFFNGIASDPPLVIAGVNGAPAPTGMKDTLANCRETGEFVVSMATWDLRDAMNLTSAHVPADVDELTLAGLTAAPSELVKPPRVAESPVHMECRVHDILDMPCTLPNSRNTMIIGQVVGIHIDDSALTDGLIDIARIKPIARLGYMDYTVVEKVFTMRRPSADEALKGAAE